MSQEAKRDEPPPPPPGYRDDLEAGDLSSMSDSNIGFRPVIRKREGSEI